MFFFNNIIYIRFRGCVTRYINLPNVIVVNFVFIFECSPSTVLAKHFSMRLASVQINVCGPTCLYSTPFVILYCPTISFLKPLPTTEKSAFVSKVFEICSAICPYSSLCCVSWETRNRLDILINEEMNFMLHIGKTVQLYNNL